MSKDDYVLFDHYYHDNIEETTIGNNFYRKIIDKNPNMQLVLMSLKPYQDI